MGKVVKNVVKVAVIGAAIATGIGAVAGLTAGASFLGLSGATAYFAQSFAVNAVLGLLSSAASSSSSTPKPEQLTSAADLTGQTVMSRSPISSRKIVYGEVKNSGAIVFLETTSKNKYLHLCVTLAAHEITSVRSIWLNDKKVRDVSSNNTEYTVGTTSSPNYSGKVKLTAHYGSDNQNADGNLVARTSMTSSHRLRGIAYIYARFEYDRDVYPSGMPNVSAIIRGRKIFDPRNNSTAYSNNSALCVLDYLRDSRYGLAATDDEIDWDSFKTAANICDETVSIIGGTEKRYTTNGVVDTSKQPAAILQDMLAACAGSISYVDGKWKIIAGAYITPTETITADDLIGAIDITTRVSNQANFNAVKGIFMSPSDDWQPVDFPAVTSSVFTAEDGGEENFIDLTLPYCTSEATAQRLGRIALQRNREQLALTLPCKLTAFKYSVGDVVMFDYARMGFESKPFEVLGWSIGGTADVPAVMLNLKETSASVYAWSTADQREIERNNSTLPDPFDVEVPSLSIADELRSYNEEVITTLIANVSTDDPFAERFEVEAQREGGEWVSLGQSTGNFFELLNVEDSVIYNVRARSITGFGIRSAWATGSHQILGKTAPPADVTNFTGNLMGDQYVLTWDAVPDLDLSYYRIRFASADGTQDYANSISLVPKVARPSTSTIVPARNGTYFIKAVDKLGIASENPSTIVLDSTLNDLTNLNVITSIEEHPDFDGTFDDVVEIDDQDRIILDTSILFDSRTGLFDDAGGWFDGGGGYVDTEGYYYFSSGFDNTAPYSTRITATVLQERVDYANVFDAASGNFDDRAGFFDGDPNAFDDTDAQIEYRRTYDDPAGSPAWGAWTRLTVADVIGRAFEFRIRLSTIDLNATPAVTYAKVDIDMKDRIVKVQDVATTAASTVVTYPDGAFKEIPALGIGAQDLQTGDYWEITSKSTSGFTIEFKDSGGTAIARTFDYTAVGYGRVIS